MVLGKRKLVAAAVAVVVLAVAGIAFVATQKPDSNSPQSAQAGEQRGPGGPGGPGGQRGPGGPGGPGGRNGGGGPPTQVTAATVSTREFASRIEDLGMLEPRERVVLTANAADRVTGVFFEDGQRVAKGKVLVTLVNDEERAQLESGQATAANAQLVFDRNQRLASNDAIAQLELERSKSAAEAAQANVAAIQARLRDRMLVAPFSGVLGFRQVSEGAYVSPGQAVATLIDDSEMRLEFGVPSINITDLRVGLPVEATTKDIPGRTFIGQHHLDRQRHRPRHALRESPRHPAEQGRRPAGRHLDERNADVEPRHVAVGPRDRGDRRRLQDIRLRRRPVQTAGRSPPRPKSDLGTRERGVVEVQAGLQSGDMVVTDGVLKLRPGAPVRIAGARRRQWGKRIALRAGGRSVRQGRASAIASRR